jgi:hypothetical protein
VGINDNRSFLESFSSTNDIEKDKIKSKAIHLVGGWRFDSFLSIILKEFNSIPKYKKSK